MHRFLRTEKLLGTPGLKRLAESRVLVVGLGAVGSYAAESLARAGVGTLGLVDFDFVNVTNINRQLFALESTLGEEKTQAAVRRLLDINPSLKAEPIRLFVNNESVEQLIQWKPDIVVDAIDSLNSKVALLQGLAGADIPVVSSMGAALRRDPSRIKQGTIGQTSGCPLAKHVRQRLRRRGVSLDIPCVYSDEPVRFRYEEPDSEPQEEHRAGEAKQGRPRRVLGSLSTLTGIFGLTAATMVIDHILDTPRASR